MSTCVLLMFCFARRTQPIWPEKLKNHSQFAVETRFFKYCVITLPCWAWILTWIWSAMWQDASKGIGLQSTPLVVPNLREWLTEPSNSLNMYTYAYMCIREYWIGLYISIFHQLLLTRTSSEYVQHSQETHEVLVLLH